MAETNKEDITLWNMNKIILNYLINTSKYKQGNSCDVSQPITRINANKCGYKQMQGWKVVNHYTWETPL